jgi:hypothetical protein
MDYKMAETIVSAIFFCTKKEIALAAISFLK